MAGVILFNRKIGYI